MRFVTKRRRKRISTAALALCALMVARDSVLACSPAGHTFVAAAAIGRLTQSRDPHAQRLARVLRKYCYVVYWGAEGPDIVQRGRGYHNSHWFPLYPVDYHHPERFDLAQAQPYFTALLKHAYAVSYGVTGADAAKHDIQLLRAPRQQWGEVSLAFACGYVTHLMSDYFCHAPAKLWWDASPELRAAVLEVAKSESYGVVQEVYAVMLWERFLDPYGLSETTSKDFLREFGNYHVDNGVLPYCALADSKAFYKGWPAKVLDHVDTSKHDLCAGPMLRTRAPGAGGCVEHERKRVLAMVEHMGISLDAAIQQSNALTSWQRTYAQVIDMLVKAFTAAAPDLGLREPGAGDLVKTMSADASRQGEPIDVPAAAGSRMNLALLCDRAAATYCLRTGETGPVTGWGQKPSGARFELHVFPTDGRGEVGIATDGPWLTKPPAGYVDGTFRLRLPQTRNRIELRARVCMFGQTERSDGVTFRLMVVDAAGKSHEFFERHTQSHDPIPVAADLTGFAGQTVSLSLISDCGPKDNCGWDWGAWLSPMVQVEAAE